MMPLVIVFRLANGEQRIDPIDYLRFAFHFSAAIGYHKEHFKFWLLLFVSRRKFRSPNEIELLHVVDIVGILRIHADKQSSTICRVHTCHMYCRGTPPRPLESSPYTSGQLDPCFMRVTLYVRRAHSFLISCNVPINRSPCR